MKRILNSLLLLSTAAILLSTSTGCKSKPKDADIKSSVETALNANPQTSGVSVDVQKGVATLNGTVADEAAKSSAGTIAGGVKGVTSVQNNITVSAPVVITPDDPLTTAVKDATKDFPGVTATVNDGVIAVTGTLSAADWKRLKMSLDGLNPKRVDASGLTVK